MSITQCAEVYARNANVVIWQRDGKIVIPTERYLNMAVPAIVLSGPEYLASCKESFIKVITKVGSTAIVGWVLTDDVFA
jgi:hypothetical protein